jgi:hypothetical protein
MLARSSAQQHCRHVAMACAQLRVIVGNRHQAPKPPTPTLFEELDMKASNGMMWCDNTLRHQAPGTLLWRRHNAAVVVMLCCAARLLSTRSPSTSLRQALLTRQTATGHT